MRVPVPVPKALVMDRWWVPFPVPRASSWKDEWFRFRPQALASWLDVGCHFRSHALSSRTDESSGSGSKSSCHGQIRGPFPVLRASLRIDEGFCFRSQDIIKDIVYGPFPFHGQIDRCMRVPFPIPSDVNKWVFCRSQNCGQMRNPVSGSGSGSTWYVLFPVPIIQTICRWEVLFPVS